MKIALILLFITTSYYVSNAQDLFRKNLYSAELIFDYMDEIDLTDGQRQKVKKIYSETNAQFLEMKLELRTLNKQMEQILEKYTVDKDAAASQLSDLLNYENRIKELKLASLIEIKNTLSEKQQKILDQYNEGYEAFQESGILIGDGYEVKLRLREQNRGRDDGTGDEQPLFIVKYKDESYTMENADLEIIDVNDIESVEVIKGQKAIEKYGSSASDGVIIVILKTRKSLQRIKADDK
jgi:hypothetical protein